jgi:cysteinyl-tRNA synthetase
MSLRLYNTLTRQKDELEKLPGFDPKNVRMYVCGPTVYDFAHIGNGRPVIVFDVLFRLLRHLYGAEHVKYVRNITDIDDKINARAAETAGAKQIPVEQARAEITAMTAKQYLDDVAALGCLPPTATPRATEYVGQMVAMIGRLVDEGHAYAAEGHVLFDVSSKADYGKLSRRSLDEMMAGARVEVAPYKKNPMDFVLWKPSDAQTPGWDSPWGRGRPGWHIECSAMGEALLGETFDIHGGGIDLMFPHHENEIAQSESVHHDHPLARIWMHNGFLQVEGEKMAKSLGNFITIRELLETDKFDGQPWPGDALRLAMLSTHYRQPIDWTANALGISAHTLHQFQNIGETVLGLGNDADMAQFVPNAGFPPSEGLLDALLDDLNTPAAIAHLHVLANRLRDGVDTVNTATQLLTDCLFMGIDPYRFELVGRNRFDEAWINEAIAARAAARKAKDFKESDRIRDELLAKGIVLKDGPTGTTWEVKR